MEEVVESRLPKFDEMSLTDLASDEGLLGALHHALGAPEPRRVWRRNLPIEDVTKGPGFSSSI